MARLLLLVLGVLGLSGPVLADLCVAGPPPLIASSSYYPVPVMSLSPVPVYAAPAVVPVMPRFDCLPGVPLATPFPAPAEPRRMPDAATRPAPPPGVSEFREGTRPARYPSASSTSFYRSFYSNPSETTRPGAPVTLTLNNDSGKAVQVLVDGVRFLLVEGQSIQRAVGNEFTWQVEGRDKEQGRVPAGQHGVKIVIDR